MNDVAANVAQRESSSIKHYASAFSNTRRIPTSGKAIVLALGKAFLRNAWWRAPFVTQDVWSCPLRRNWSSCVSK